MSAFIGPGHELIGGLRYEGDDVPGDVGSVEPVAGGGCPVWRPSRTSMP
ncbi:hypothetical protein [Streptomyces chartreusis]